MTCVCGYEFVLDKQLDEGLTDGRFLAAAKRASRDDTAYFTENQLYTALCRTLFPRFALRYATALWIVGGPIAVFLLFVGQPAVAMLIAIFITLFSLMFLGRRLFYSPPDRYRLPDWIQRIRAGGHRLDRLIDKPSLDKPPPDWSEPDIYDYGVERLLVVERPLLVDLLVKNGLHSEARTLIVSEGGYPSHIMNRVPKLFEERPDLPVFILHDATPDGLGMRQRMSESRVWSGVAQNAVDLGVFPDDLKKLGLPALRGNRDGWALPVDTLNPSVLAGLLGTALSTGDALADVIANKLTSEDGVGYG
ncbi:MAG: hypothetical protein AAFQ65_11000 [Myxococcota bacterium]